MEIERLADNGMNKVSGILYSALQKLDDSINTSDILNSLTTCIIATCVKNGINKEQFIHQMGKMWDRTTRSMEQDDCIVKEIIPEKEAS